MIQLMRVVAEWNRKLYEKIKKLIRSFWSFLMMFSNYMYSCTKSVLLQISILISGKYCL